MRESLGLEIVKSDSDVDLMIWKNKTYISIWIKAAYINRYWRVIFPKLWKRRLIMTWFCDPEALSFSNGWKIKRLIEIEACEDSTRTQIELEKLVFGELTDEIGCSLKPNLLIISGECFWILEWIRFRIRSQRVAWKCGLWWYPFSKRKTARMMKMRIWGLKRWSNPQARTRKGSQQRCLG